MQWGPGGGLFVYGAVSQWDGWLVVALLVSPLYVTLMLAARKVGPVLGEALAKWVERLGGGGPGQPRRGGTDDGVDQD